jgi:hypothetical protein
LIKNLLYKKNKMKKFFRKSINNAIFYIVRLKIGCGSLNNFIKYLIDCVLDKNANSSLCDAFLRRIELNS